TCLSVMIMMSVWRRWRLLGKVPPEPTPLPFIGNFLELETGKFYDSLSKIRERYGPVFTIHLGPRPAAVLWGYDAAKEALIDQAEEFSDRGEQAFFAWFFKGFLYRAKQLRRFSIATLKDFSFGKRGIEERLIEETSFLIQAFRDTNGEIPIFYMSRTVSNVISSIVFGDRFEYDDKEFLSLWGLITRSFQFLSTATGQLFEMFYSVMKHLPGCQHQAYKDFQGLEDFVARKVEQNQSTLDPSPQEVLPVAMGTETVSPTMRYGFLLLMKNPDIAAKIHEEIDQVIRRNQPPKYEDHLKMPYTEAVIYEIQRFVDVIPFGLPRSTIKNIKFRDFLIPKGTDVLPVLSSHFLGDKGQFKKSNAFVPFSIGKRYCFGESLNFCFKSPQAPQTYCPHNTSALAQSLENSP
uniref:Uncharacterized protein n=1 Tax=Cricetulus griseus TaxID=10029 RepID=A0A8C2QEU4_CRIGR